MNRRRERAKLIRAAKRATLMVHRQIIERSVDRELDARAAAAKHKKGT